MLVFFGILLLLLTARHTDTHARHTTPLASALPVFVSVGSLSIQSKLDALHAKWRWGEKARLFGIHAFCVLEDHIETNDDDGGSDAGKWMNKQP